MGSRATATQLACTWQGSGYTGLSTYQSRSLIHPLSWLSLS